MLKSPTRYGFRSYGFWNGEGQAICDWDMCPYTREDRGHKELNQILGP